MNTSFTLQGTGEAALASKLTLGTSYDFYLVVAPTGDNYLTNTPAIAGGIWVKELPN